jgi:hypothetical protein
MKSIFFKRFLFAAAVGTMVTGCIHDDNFDNVDTECVTLTPTKTVQEIYDMADEGTPELYTGEDIIEAYVTSSDAGGTFYKSISFQSVDGTLGFSIPVDMYNIYTEFEPGRKVYVDLNGRYFNKTNDGLIIGDLYQETSVGRLVPEEFRRTVMASCETVDEDEIVQHLTIDQLLDDANINKLVELDNVQFEDAALGTTYFNPADQIGGATNIYLMDQYGDQVIFRTSEFAKFAGHLVPSANGKVRGVLTKFGNDYQFLARTEDDIMLTNPRVIPPLNESFTSSLGAWTTFSVTGAEAWAHSPTFGNPGGMAQMSGYAGGNHVNEDWLISPVQDLSAFTGGAVFSFDNAYKFTGNPIVAMISNNYSGTGDPNNATWTPLSANLSLGNYVYVNSGNIDISAFTGAGNENVYVAFKYTSTNSAASTWEIDNVKIIPN